MVQLDYVGSSFFSVEKLFEMTTSLSSYKAQANFILSVHGIQRIFANSLNSLSSFVFSICTCCTALKEQVNAKTSPKK